MRPTQACPAARASDGPAHRRRTSISGPASRAARPVPARRAAAATAPVSSRAVSPARARAAGSGWRTSGASSCANRPTSRSAAARNARRCRGSRPYRVRPGDRRRRSPPRRRRTSPADATGTRPQLLPARPAARRGIPVRSTSSCAGRPRVAGGAAPARRRHRRPARAAGRPGGARRAPTRQLLPDHPQRQILVALGGQHEPQPVRRRPRVLAVAGGGALRLDQPLGLEEPQLRDGRVGELGAQVGQHLADAHQRSRAGRGRCPGLAVAAAPGDVTRRPSPSGRGPAMNTSRNLPICTSSPLLQRRRLDPFAVDVGAVEAPDVADGERAAVAVELGVPAGDGHVVEEDVTVRVPAAGRHVVVEQEPGAGVRAAAHHQQRHARRQRAGHRGWAPRRSRDPRAPRRGRRGSAWT